MSDRFLGPFKIIQLRGRQAYELALPMQWKIHPVFHVSLLEKHVRRENAQIPREAVEVDSDGEHFEVESIQDHKTMHGKRYYLVQWLGWAPSYNEWLPADDLDCQDLLEAYEGLLQGRTPFERRIRRAKRS